MMFCGKTMPMKTALAVTLGLIAGFALASLLPMDRATRTGIEKLRYFDVRSTATMFDASDPVREVGPIRHFGSQELAFIEGDATVRIYLVSHGKKELLHDLEVNPDWFRSVWFTIVQRKSEKVGIVLTARSLLRSAASKAIPEGYKNVPSMFDRNWEYDLGKIASITPTCNEHATTYPLWKPGAETPALCYQFSRDKENFRPLAQKGNILFSKMSEEAMIEASGKDLDVAFVLVTVQVHPE